MGGVEPPPGLSPVASSTSAGSTSPSQGGNHSQSDIKQYLFDRDVGDSVEWRIDGISDKLRLGGGMLVSPDYTVSDMCDVRLIFDAGANWAEEDRKRKRKSRGRGGVCDRPAYGSIKLKVGDPRAVGVVKFILHVGMNSQGPYEYDFGETSVQECVLTCNWFERLNSDSLCLRLEFL